MMSKTAQNDNGWKRNSRGKNETFIEKSVRAEVTWRGVLDCSNVVSSSSHHHRHHHHHHRLGATSQMTDVDDNDLDLSLPPLTSTTEI